MRKLATLAALKLSLFLLPRWEKDAFDRYGRILIDDITEEEMASYSELPEDLFSDSPTAARYRLLYDRLEGNAIALTAVQLCMLAQLDCCVLDLLRDISGANTSGLTIETAARITMRHQTSLEMTSELRDAFGLVAVLLQAETRHPDFSKTPFQPDGRLAAWLSGDDRIDYQLSAACRVFARDTPLPEPLHMQRELADTCRLLDPERFCVMHIEGEPSSGKRFFVQHVAADLDRDILFVPASLILESSRLKPGLWQKVLRELYLNERCLCIEGLQKGLFDGDHQALAELLHTLERDCGFFSRPLFLTSSTDIKALPHLHCDVYTVVMRGCTMEESHNLWHAFSQQYLAHPDRFPASLLAARMRHTAGQMQQVVRLTCASFPEEDYTHNQIFHLCYQVLDDGRYENIHRVSPAFTWEDLKLPEYPRLLLQCICDQVTHQMQVLDEWGFGKKVPYGRCISALFSGPPGTGKTMAAQVLAAQLGLDIYKVDISQVVDKYIGESEKRLKQVFDQAERCNMILLFDEADALFGKRSEVKDAKDKYANTEVSYLLQRIEEYSGIVLMTTNLATNIDHAFLRRFRYVVPFTLPDENLRRQLWASLLDERVPQADLDFAYMAKQFEIPGSQIKNIALNACYRAASDDGVLTMKHLLEAVYLEHRKEGRLVMSEEFGAYSGLANDVLHRQHIKL